MSAASANPGEQRGERLSAWRERLVLLYPHGMKAAFDPRGRFVKPGDRLNGYVVDRLEAEPDEVVAVLAYH